MISESRVADGVAPSTEEVGNAAAEHAWRWLFDALGASDAALKVRVETAERILRLDPTGPAATAQAELLLSFARTMPLPEFGDRETWHYAAMLMLGHMYRGLGRYADARDAFRRAFDWRPELPDAVNFLTELASLSGDPAVADATRDEHLRLVGQRIETLPVWAPPVRNTDIGSMYLNLLEKTLCNWIYGDASHPSYGDTRFSPSRREVGRDLPVEAHSMIGLRRLMHLRWAAETVLAEGVGGDFIEAGVWRGGACVLMRGVLAAHGVRDRRVFVADSFAGLPPPDPRHAKDLATVHSFHGRPELAVGLEEVRNNFRSYELLDDQVVFVPGWFKDTLTCIPTMRLAILRIDGDLYASTMDTLEALYDKLSIGGFLICDDYGVVVDARRAILDFRMARGITTPMSAVDGDAIFWRKDR